jgi:addiction module HigA family antidote
MLKRGMRPTHPGAILREDILKELALTITETAKGLKVSRKQLSEIVNSKAAITPEMALRLEHGFGVSASFWLDLQKKYDLWQVEHSGRVEGIRRFSPTTTQLSA